MELIHVEHTDIAVLAAEDGIAVDPVDDGLDEQVVDAVARHVVARVLRVDVVIVHVLARRPDFDVLHMQTAQRLSAVGCEPEKLFALARDAADRLRRGEEDSVLFVDRPADHQARDGIVEVASLEFDLGGPLFHPEACNHAVVCADDHALALLLVGAQHAKAPARDARDLVQVLAAQLDIVNGHPALYHPAGFGAPHPPAGLPAPRSLLPRSAHGSLGAR